MQEVTMSEFYWKLLVMNPFLEKIDLDGSILRDIMLLHGRRLQKQAKGRSNFILLIPIILSTYEMGGLKLWDL
jgi:hypothetical protein